MKMMIVAVIVAVAGLTYALDNGVGRTPAMGYNTWNDFRCSGINAANVMAVADKMVELGLNFAGYHFVNIDDCWSVGRNATTGVLIPDPQAFPDGIAPLAAYIHSLGMKFGMYTDRGTYTCAGRPGSEGYEQLDAETFASWGVDYLKEDSCNASDIHDVAFYEYSRMRDALNNTGREIYFSLCGWNSWYAPVGWTLGNSWRIAGDCNQWPSVYNAIITNQGLSNYSRPGGWNDPDMLVGSSPQAAVYNTPDQSRTQFSLWAVMAAPLLIGSNMLNMTAFDYETYSNTEVIAVDQDPLGIQGQVIWENCPEPPNFNVQSCQQIWARPLFDGSYALCFVNFAQNNVTVSCDEACLGTIGMQTALVRDLWAHEDLGVFDNFTSTVAANGASQTYRFFKQS